LNGDRRTRTVYRLLTVCRLLRERPKTMPWDSVQFTGFSTDY